MPNLVSRDFHSLEEACKATRPYFPVDYFVAIGGDTHRPARRVHSEEDFAQVIQEAKFGTHPGDKIVVWLPEAAEVPHQVW